jgi:hypothetical protein
MADLEAALEMGVDWSLRRADVEAWERLKRPHFFRLVQGMCFKLHGFYRCLF